MKKRIKAINLFNEGFFGLKRNIEKANLSYDEVEYDYFRV